MDTSAKQKHRPSRQVRPPTPTLRRATTNSREGTETLPYLIMNIFYRYRTYPNLYRYNLYNNYRVLLRLLNSDTNHNNNYRHYNHNIVKYDIMSLVINLKNNLKKLRKEKGLTQIALQMQTGIEQALISKYENGERIPPTETLIILADFFNTNIDYLLGRTDNSDKI